MGDLVGPIIEILKFIGPPLYKCIMYHRKLEEYKENLKRILEELKGQKDEIELRLKVECGFGKLEKSEVKKWLENVGSIAHDAENVEQTFKKAKCFPRVRLAKLVDEKIQQVEEYHQTGRSFTRSNSLVIDAPPSIGRILPTPTLVGETTAKKTMEEIWRHLMSNEIKKIGICGMGGVGKTTIMTHINNKLTEEKKFDHVFWVTVSQALDLVSIQNRIANALKQSPPSSDDPKMRASDLWNMLKGKRFVLILDDMWEAIQLDEVGIPEPTEQNRCKLVKTTRSSDVCRSMGCEEIDVEPLSENEALELFIQKAELDIFEVPTLKEIVELVVKQCGGLPLAIVTIASSLKGVNDIQIWRDVLNDLFNNVKSIKVKDEQIFARLKFSYDRLEDENIQHCFSYCALYPEDFDIPKDELMDCWIREGLVIGKDNLQAKEDRAHSTLTVLINNCLLLESTDYDERSSVKLHDVVRDMILKYITSKSPLFMVKPGQNLTEPPSEQEWKENLDKVSLMENFIREIPSSMSPNCQTLSTLLLQGNPLKSISESFFSQMHGLKVLNLSKTDIESLPNSISELTNLTALLLYWCQFLKHVPSLAKLRSLRELELGLTGIKEVPVGMGMLTNLTSLGLLSERYIHKLPVGMFPKLCHLEKLEVYWGRATPREAIEEATRLKNLHRLVAKFDDLQDFNYCVKSLNIHQYFLVLSSTSEPCNWRERQYDANKEVLLEGLSIHGREEVDSIFLPKDVEALTIFDCNDVRNICDIPTFNILERLEILDVEELENLTTLLDVSESSPGKYSHLKGVHVEDCVALKKMFSSKLLSELKNLEWIEVEACDGVEELIAVDEDDDNYDKRNQKEFHLPNLKRLELNDIRNLKSICSGNGVMLFDSLQVIKVESCPQLKKIISTSKLQLDVLKNLEEIEINGCDEMEEIIALDDVDEEETSEKELIHLPKLRKLYLWGMRKLKRIINNGGSTGVMVCESLQQVIVRHCPQLKRLPLYLPIDDKGGPSPPPALKIIDMSREEWEALKGTISIRRLKISYCPCVSSINETRSY